MKLNKTIATIFTFVLGAAAVSGQSERSRALHVTKNCSVYTGTAGGFCTITSSSLPAIKVGSKVFYLQANGIVAGLLDSNVVLDAGSGDRAVGHCTLDDTTGVGLCTFSDGIGAFAGFQARLDVSPFPAPDMADFHWDGTYSFNLADAH
jgi:hypothetical protein